MSGFTDDEVAAEMKRRNEAIKQGEENRRLERDIYLRNCDTVCISCNNQMQSWEATDRENPLCNFCMGD